MLRCAEHFQFEFELTLIIEIITVAEHLLRWDLCCPVQYRNEFSDPHKES